MRPLLLREHNTSAAMSIILSDADRHLRLLPLTFTRPVGLLRPGVLTLAEVWAKRSGLPVSFRAEEHLQERFPLERRGPDREVDAGLLPDQALVDAVLDLEPGQMLVKKGRLLAIHEEGDARPSPLAWSLPPTYLHPVEFAGEVLELDRPWDLFRHCGAAIRNDFDLITEGRRSQPVGALNTVIGDPKLVFLEEGAVMEACILNTTNGPIHIGRNAEVMEGSMLRGPVALGAGAQIKMGAKIYGPSAFGPECRVGGEVNNSVMLGYSNKGHDGFLGNSVLGEWCNLGADTNNSNLKNTYGEVKAWSYVEEDLVNTGLQFCGLIMGDHSKSGINTMFNTGTVVGVCCNIFGSGFPPKMVPSFTWGAADGFMPHAVDKAIATARLVMERRQVALSPEDEAILRRIALR